MSRHIRKRKIQFTALSLLLVFSIGFGVEAFRGADFWTPLRSLSYLGYRFRYAREQHLGWYRSLFSVFQATPALAAGTTDGIPVLVYHGIVAHPDRFSMTQATFRDQMFAMKHAGYETITLQDYEDSRQSKKMLPEKSFILTFDDGRMDSYLGADPILKAIGYHAVMFVALADSIPSTGTTQAYYISTATIKTMIRSGRWEIGSHAIQDGGGFVPLDGQDKKGNFLSNRKWIAAEGRLENDQEYAARISHELGDSKRILEKTFDIKVNAFSYPFGDFGQQSVNNETATTTVSTAIEADYSLAFRQVWMNDGMYALNYPDTDPLFLKRIETPTDWSGSELLDYLAVIQDKPLPFQDDFKRESGWLRVWGDVHAEDDRLVMSATNASTGAAAFLDGTKSWDEYEYDATFDWKRGNYVTLMAGIKDIENYVSCSYGEDRVKIDMVAGGKVTHIADMKNWVSLSGGKTTLGMRVAGGSVKCLVGSKVEAFADVPTTSGGIGLKIWDPQPSTAEVRLEHVSVVPTAKE